jgi:hypothetical protein
MKFEREIKKLGEELGLARKEIERMRKDDEKRKSYVHPMLMEDARGLLIRTQQKILEKEELINMIRQASGEAQERFNIALAAKIDQLHQQHKQAKHQLSQKDL